MNRKTLKLIVLIAFAISLLVIFFGVSNYIENKDERLKQEVSSNLTGLFEGKRFIDVDYSGEGVVSNKVNIPGKPLLEYSVPNNEAISAREEAEYKKSAELWESFYENLTHLYQVDRESGNNGWQLISVEYSDAGYGGVKVSYHFPYAVGYCSDVNPLSPTVESAIEEAFEFFTTKSDIGVFEEGSFDRIISEVDSLNNEYYLVEKDSYPILSSIGRGRVSGDMIVEVNDDAPYPYTYMFNGEYKVFLAESQPVITYTIKEVYDAAEKEAHRLWLILSITLFVLFLLIYLPLEKKGK